MSRSIKLKTAGVVLLFLSGAIGGASFFLDILKYYHAPDFLASAVSLVYFCAFCLVFSKVQLKEEAQENEERIRQEGYDAGFDAGQRSSAAMRSADSYQRGYDAGLSAGRNDSLSARAAEYTPSPLPELKYTEQQYQQYGQQRADAAFRRVFYGRLNPYTGKPILTESDYKEYVLAKSQHMIST